MQYIVESVDKVQTTDKGTSSQIKTTGGDVFYVQEDARGLIGKTIDAEVNVKTSGNGRQYKTGKIIKVHETAVTNNNGNGNGKITWDAYRAMAEAAHDLAHKLEPDGVAPHIEGDDHGYHTTVDRSSARAAILNTVMIAYSNGKIFVPAEDDDIPPF